MSITVTPDLSSTPPRNTITVSSGVGSVMQTVSLKRTDHDGTALVRTQPVAGFESRTIDDFFMPYEEGVTYSWDATYLAPATNVFAETWASLAAWTTSGGSWAVSAGTLVWSAADSLVASVSRAVTAGRYRTVFSAVPKGIAKIDFGGFYIDALNSRLVLGAASQAFVPGTTTWTIDVTPTSVTITTSSGTYSVAGAASVTQVKFLGPIATYSFGATFGSVGVSNGQFGGGASAIATDSSGNVYVADPGNSRVQKFNSAGVFQLAFGSAGTGNGQFGGFIAGIAVDSSGNIFVLDQANSRVQKFSSLGAYVSQFGSAGGANGQFTSPYGLALDSTGNIYVADTGNSRVQKFSSAGAYTSQFAAGLSPEGIAVDSTGNIYVADEAGNALLKYSSAFALLGSLTAPNARSVAVDSTGHLYVGTNTLATGLIKVDPALEQVQAIARYGVAQGQVYSAVGVAIGASNALWVADYQPRMQRFDRQATSVPAVTLQAYGTIRSISETSAPAPVACHDTWIIHPGSPAKSFKLQNLDPVKAGIRTFGDVGNPSNSNLHYIMGSKTPVQSNSGPRQDDILSVTIATVSSLERIGMRAVLADDVPLLIQVPPSWKSDFNCGFYSFGDPVERRRVDHLARVQPARLFDCSITKVQPPVVNVENSGWSWAQLAAEFATWDDVVATFATWDDLAANNRS